MPKERVNSRHDGIHEPFGVVGWSKDQGYVEVGALYAGEVTVDNDVPLGWYVQLDRAGINRMIRVLRQARDQAFGRDE